MLEPNGVFDITHILSDKLMLIGNIPRQIKTVDHVSYAQGLARVRAYHNALWPRRQGAAEAFINQEYCEIASAILTKERVLAMR